MENNSRNRYEQLMQLDPERYIRLQDADRLADYFDSFHAVPDPAAARLLL